MGMQFQNRCMNMYKRIESGFAEDNSRHEARVATAIGSPPLSEHVNRSPRRRISSGPVAPVHIEQDRVLARRSQGSVVQERRLPVEDALSHSVADILENGHGVLDPGALASSRDGDRCRQGDVGAFLGPVSLRDKDGLVVGCNEAVQGLEEVGESCAGAVEGVEGNAHAIDIAGRDGAGGEETLVEPQLRSLVPAVVGVDDDDGVDHAGGDCSRDTVACGFPERGEIGEVAIGDFTEREEHAVGDFVAERHNGGIDAGLVEGLERGGHVGLELRGQRCDRCGRPSGGNSLVRWVGPGVAEVEVKVDGIALRVEALSKCKSVGGVVGSGGPDATRVSLCSSLSY